MISFCSSEQSSSRAWYPSGPSKNLGPQALYHMVQANCRRWSSQPSYVVPHFLQSELWQPIAGQQGQSDKFLGL